MGLYREFDFVGIVKPQYRAEINSAFEKDDWKAASGEFRELLDSYLRSYEWDDLVSPLRGRGVFLKSSFDPESGMLKWARYFKTYYDTPVGVAKFVRSILPAATEKLISITVWDEADSYWGDAYWGDGGMHDLTKQFVKDTIYAGSPYGDLLRPVNSDLDKFFPKV